MDGALDQDATARAAVLAGVVEDAVRRGRGSLLEVGVGEHDVGALAAQLERDPLDLVGGAAHDPLAHLGRPGEADLPHRGVADEPLADDRALARDHREDALRDPGLERELADAEGGHRGQLGRLEHDAVARGERRCEAPAGDRHREVPRDDHADDAERLLERHVRARRPPGSAARTSAPARPRSSRARRGRCRPPSARCRWCGRRCAPRAVPAPRSPRRPCPRTRAASGRGRPGRRGATRRTRASAFAIAASVSSVEASGISVTSSSVAGSITTCVLLNRTPQPR